ncbi:cytochrome d ubiquinol oxidase subunit II [Allorhodopirellula solitaria]|uniref:Glycosyltransferase RgtA/B/C/D-like domain-containing protein n=1 Tax=Allorhodopirellula solitaria TaxID=2527987 RepID=A0A5C5XY05_9BACT|nr:cytochrome d ubiquinol oxidase subunit II [Allorhodopirellula solitaria]TWT67439.1 hypothetical protein CA85_22900 [Allorhodopirellula solitaria]
MRKHDEPRNKRLLMHGILIVIALALVAGRIATVINPEGDAAFLSANDRSRWVTVAALVEQQTFEIDELISIQTDRGHRLWDTIDKVRHIGEDGRLHYYSSKPTLLTTMVAGVYWGVRRITGLNLSEHPIYVPRLLLLLINLPLLALFLITMTLSIELSSAQDLAKRLAVIASCFATMLTPFAIALNNHLFAAAATSLTLYLYLRASEKIHDSFAGITYRPTFLVWAVAGMSAAFAVACELPALSMFALWAVLFALLMRRSMIGFLAGAGLVAVGIFGTNYWAHQTWKTPYAHRGDGSVVTVFSSKDLEAADTDNELRATLEGSLQRLDPLSGADSIAVRKLNGDAAEFEVVADFHQDGRIEQQQWKVRRGETGGENAKWELVEWDDWYDYPGSYWRTGRRSGVDRGEPSRVVYALQATVGYYGLFSLTPIWLLVPSGLIHRISHGPRDRRYLAAAIVTATVVCFLFYVARPEIDRNYGGVSVCFRWMLWFTPLWVYAIVTEFDRLTDNWAGGLVVLGLLAASVFSVSASLESPWQSPWLYQFASFLGWIS